MDVKEANLKLKKNFNGLESHAMFYSQSTIPWISDATYLVCSKQSSKKTMVPALHVSKSEVHCIGLILYLD